MPLDQFLDSVADAFTRGHLDVAADTLAAPLVVHCGTRSIAARHHRDVVNALRVYRANLERECFRETRVELHFASEPVDGRVQALVTWRHYNDRGAEITALEAAYIFAESDDGRWRASDVDFMPAPNQARMTDGLALV